ncbi:MAG: metal-dependent hydrolase [Chlorobiaceae bacterium]
MIIAHAPAGYIVSKLLFKRFLKCNVSYNFFIAWGMIGAIAPDFDLLYYYPIDHQQHYHHEYFTHFPLFWLSLVMISVMWLLSAKNQSQHAALTFIFTLNGFIHMVLDTIAGEFMLWLAPFSHRSVFGLDKYLPWSRGFSELFIILIALYLWKNKYIKTVLSKLDTQVSKR